MTFTKYKCWQTERIGRVIAKAALDIDRATFLATHMPMKKISYEVSPLQIASTNEDDFLAEINRMDSENLHVFAVIKGIPGTGKSHLIRWLYEMYKQHHPNENVILIERANTSLKRTIEQIISSRMFTSAALANELKQLKGATDALSESGLEDTLLNHLQVGVREVEEKWGKKLHHRIAAEKIYNFLLDINVREHLKKNNGPIKRVVSYMQEGRGIGEDEAPGFEPEDLIFDAQQKGAIQHGGYQDAQDVAEVISRSNDRQRIQLTRYLNFVLRSYAISRTTNLTASDLREMFNELRRELRKDGQNLALFIEDITAFTGIDSGLIDVLITEHRGEKNKEFCKLTSVVGITDGFYADNIPPNVRERISHLLTLSTKSGGKASDMLENKTTLLEFSARYLNAIRLSNENLVEWEEGGSDFNQIPNACVSCEFVEACHDAFGYIDISLSSTSQGNDVGLYPFNSTSIERLYQSLVDTVSRTPRSLLNDVISYILQSHSEKIEGGEFPPSDKVLAPKIKTLEFDPPEHRRIIEQQGGQDVERLITLLLFWGNRSAFQADQNGENYVGGISPSVFNAFSLPTIQGRSDSVTEIVVQVPESVDEITDDGQDRDVSSLDEKTKNEHLKDITAWADGGRLYRHSDFLRWMGQLFIHFIDWQHHGIAPSLVPSSNKASSIFAIEDQSAQIMGHRLVFDRSSKLRYALIALAQLNNTDVSLTPEQYSEYITALNIWIETEENRIVAFIQDHTETQDLHNDTLSQILLENAVILACLSGNLSADMSFYDLYKTIIQTCNGKENFLKNQWQMSMNRLNQHSSWINLMRKIQTDVGIVREETLQQFNSVQGDSTEIQFLKAANLISLLKEFETNNWEINDLENLPKSGSGLDRWWESALRIREVLKKDFQTVITTTYNEINNSFNDLNNILGDNDPSDIIENIQGLLQNLQSKSPIDLRFQSGLHTIEVDNLRLIKNEIMQLKGYESNIKISKYLSKRANYLFALITPYLQYFKDLVRAIENKRTELQNSNSGSLKIQVDGQLNKTEQKYIQVLQAIDQSLQEE